MQSPPACCFKGGAVLCPHQDGILTNKYASGKSHFTALSFELSYATGSLIILDSQMLSGPGCCLCSDNSMSSRSAYYYIQQPDTVFILRLQYTKRCTSIKALFNRPETRAKLCVEFTHILCCSLYKCHEIRTGVCAAAACSRLRTPRAAVQRCQHTGQPVV